MLLQNFDFINQFLDLENNQIIYSDSKKKTTGWYKDVNGLIVALFVEDSKLLLRVNNLNYYIDDFSFASLENTKDREHRAFYLHDRNAIVIRFYYEIEMSFNQISPFEYLDDDQFDWGLFLLNIINDQSRKIQFINSNI